MPTLDAVRSCFTGTIQANGFPPSFQGGDSARGDGDHLAALLAQAKVQAVVLAVHVANVHRERRADPGEGVEYRGDERAVAKARQGRVGEGAQQSRKRAAARVWALRSCAAKNPTKRRSACAPAALTRAGSVVPMPSGSERRGEEGMPDSST